MTRLEAQHIKASARSRRSERWTGGDESRWEPLSRLPSAVAARDPDRATGMVPAPAETVALWCERAKSMGRDDLEDFERRTFAAWDRDSVSNDRGDRDDQFDDQKSIAFGPVPPELMERWIGAARTMDAIVLEASSGAPGAIGRRQSSAAGRRGRGAAPCVRATRCDS
jgi:hypothetical protein